MASNIIETGSANAAAAKISNSGGKKNHNKVSSFVIIFVHMMCIDVQNVCIHTTVYSLQFAWKPSDIVFLLLIPCHCNNNAISSHINQITVPT